MSEDFPQPLMQEHSSEPDPYKEGLADIETKAIDGEAVSSGDDDETPSVEKQTIMASEVSEAFEASEPTPEALLPPEAQGAANGGPLGCCLGVTVGLLLSLSIAIVGRLYGDTFASVFQGYLAIIIRIIMVLVAIGAAILCGYFGWKIGKRAYREYDSPVVKNSRQKARARRV